MRADSKPELEVINNIFSVCAKSVYCFIVMLQGHSLGIWVCKGCRAHNTGISKVELSILNWFRSNFKLIAL